MKILCSTAAAALVMAAAPQALAQAYPSKPIRMIVPFSPGGAADVPARIIAQRVSEVIGQQIVVENRPGAGGTIGADAAARAPADGYTLLFISNTQVISQSLYSRLKYDIERDFAPVMQVGAAPNVLVVHPSMPVKTVKDLVALAKSRPGQIDYASSGNGSSQHLFAALFTSLAGIKMNHIPYRGSAQATTDLISGHVQVSFPGINNVLQHVKSGRLRALGVTSAERASSLPQVPTLAEAGVPGYEAVLWLGVLVPSKTPGDVIAKLNREMSAALAKPETQAAIAATGTGIVATDPAKFGALLRSERAKWAKVVKETGAKVN